MKAGYRSPLALAFAGGIAALSSILLTHADNLRPGQRVTALDEYIKKADDSYGYKVVLEKKGPGYTYFVLELTSQTWRTKKDVDRPVWKHHMNMIVPDVVKSDASLLAISGGSNGREPRDDVRREYAQFAALTGSVVTELQQVPNQPLVYTGESKGRVEDESVSYTWDKYLRTGDKEWPLQLPMTKSAVRAMDAITDFCASERGGKNKVERFVVAGASKRGWTTWLTAAVDKRVIAIAPIVIDMLNVIPSFQHHFRVYGFYAPAVQDYVDMGIMDWMETPEYKALTQFVDPYEYRNRLTMPKYIVNGSGDQFFLPDSHQFYFDDLLGEKMIRYVPNADHGLGGSDAWEGLIAWYQTILDDKPRPDFTWKIADDGTIHVDTKVKPLEVKLWQASNANARDFRVETIGKTWQASDLAPASEGKYAAKVSAPGKGFTAYYIELRFPGSPGLPLVFSTGVHVTPDSLPFDPYKPKPVK
ncbi:MAG: PhoPQ-activated pathogenicity-related protein [Verrucomicrobiales bacterium]|jgi:PhoPQ-activated pathogenicity-related protein